jgi:acetyl-CoA carboxylase biotin carboxylase subunit
LDEPSGPGVRVDSGVYQGWRVPVEYDPLLAKLVVWAESREQAIARLRRALHEYSITGIRTNLGFFRDVLDDREFLAGNLHTGFIEEYLKRRPASEPDPELEAAAALASVAHASTLQPDSPHPLQSKWLSSGRSRLLR